MNDNVNNTDKPIGWIAQNAVGHYYFRLKKPDDVYKPFPVFKPKENRECEYD